jgi:sugar-specific transcriptional regulator TrmB
MRAVALLLVAEAVLLRSNSQVRAGKSIDAVIDVLGKMLKDFNDMAAEDKDNWEKYSKWSADEETDRRSFIQNQEGVVMSATAMLNANKQQVQTLTGQIADLTSEIAETQSSINELVKLRQEEHKTHE